MAEHTKGPWKARDLGEGEFDIIAPFQDEYLYIAMMDGGFPSGEMEANAHLIAAAPLLLEALREIDRIANTVHPCRDGHVDVLHDVICHMREVAWSAIAATEGSE